MENACVNLNCKDTFNLIRKIELDDKGKRIYFMIIR